MDQFEKAASFNFLLEQWKIQGKHSTNLSKLAIPRSDNAIVGARIRSILLKEAEEGHMQGVFDRDVAAGAVDVVDVHQMVLGGVTGARLRSSEYYLDRLYTPTATTEEIYSTLVRPLLHLGLQGGIGTCFAYGQTGAGKTYTITALSKLVAQELLKEIPRDHNVFVSIFELGGTLNAAYDLLNNRQPISILEDSFGDTRVKGAREIRVAKSQELIDLIDTANGFRRIGKTYKNDQSSRSHAICKLTFTNTRAPAAPDGVLYLIDLAGSEIGSDTVRHTPELMKEAKQINKSLSVLKECVRGRALSGEDEAQAKPYVPFRHSALTKVLKHVFDPSAERECKTAVIACLNPSFLDVEGTKNTLRYAEMLRVPIPARKKLEFDEKVPKTWDNTQTQEWIKKNSGDPQINADLLATYHTGSQLIKMPKREFIDRCLATIDVSIEQAEAFHAKLWRLHVDAKYANNAASGANDVISRSSAATGDVGVDFKQRIKPGMVVKHKMDTHGEKTGEMALILSKVLGDLSGNQSEKQSYLCSVVSKAEYQDGYELNVWHQRIVAVEDMTEEVVLEYDPATRYYFLVI